MRGPAQPTKPSPLNINQPKRVISRFSIVSSIATTTLVGSVPPYTAAARESLPRDRKFLLPGERGRLSRQATAETTTGGVAKARGQAYSSPGRLLAATA